MTSAKRLNPLICLLIVLGALTTTEKVNSAINTELLNSMCLLSFESEMSLAEIIPPKEMAAFTCKCFTKKIATSSSLQAAKEDCKKEASEKFNI